MIRGEPHNTCATREDDMMRSCARLLLALKDASGEAGGLLGVDADAGDGAGAAPDALADGVGGLLALVLVLDVVADLGLGGERLLDGGDGLDGLGQVLAFEDASGELDGLRAVNADGLDGLGEAPPGEGGEEGKNIGMGQRGRRRSWPCEPFRRK